MSLRRMLALVGAASLGFALANACSAPAAEVDYGRADAWLCRPSRHDACDTRLDAVRLAPDGAQTVEAFHAAAAPAIDCFYVYPTVSRENGDYSDMSASPEVVAVARTQAARFSAQCRVFAPLYRQMTLPGLKREMQSSFGGIAALDFDPPYRDIRAAWRAYLAHDNHGRGVVLIGHSQGSILLARLMAEEIDAKPDQQLLVSAILAGHPGLAVPDGRDVGGAFTRIPVCHTADQTGCFMAWSSYLADDANPRRVFGRDPGPGLVAACVDPAALLGSTTLDGFIRRPASTPPTEPPFLELRDLLSGRCVRDVQGTVLRVGNAPGANAASLEAILGVPSPSGWGLHPLDVALTQGDLVRVVGAEAASWRRAAAPAPAARPARPRA